jgi:hypothetical protein
MQDDHNKTRREAIKMTAATAGIGVVTTANVVATDGAPSTTELGIEERVSDLFRSGEYDRAAALMDEYGVKHETKTFSLGVEFVEQVTADGEEVTTQKIFKNPSKSDSEQTLSARYLGGNLHRITHSLELVGAGNLGIDGAGPKDPFAVSYSENSYRFIPGSISTSDRVSKKDSHPHGVSAEFTDDDIGFVGAATMEFNVEPKTTATTTLYGDYIHTWNPFQLPSQWKFSFNLTGAGAINTEVGGYVEKYRSEQNIEYTP